MNRIILVNGKVILPDEILENGYVVIEGEKILHVGKGDIPETDETDQVIDVRNHYISPGFIDIHVHGGGGYDFMDATVDAFLKIAETHAKHGTTALLPTTLTSTNEELFHTFDIYRQAAGINVNGSRFLGIHLEGPYFSYNQRGAQDPEFLRSPRPEEYLAILEASDDIVRWSLAPELDGALEMGRLLRSRNILPSVAHTDAVCEEVTDAFESGFTLMTHLYSAMSSVVRKNAYRYAGAVEAAYLIDNMDVEIIADGVHLPKSLLQFVCKFKDRDRIALVTDSMRAAGMPDGNYALGSLQGGRQVIVEDGVAKLPDRSAFAGSVATADRLVRTMVQVAGIPLTDAIRMISRNPARIMKIDETKGTIMAGKDADLVVFDEDIRVRMTFREGRQIYGERIPIKQP